MICINEHPVWKLQPFVYVRGMVRVRADAQRKRNVASRTQITPWPLSAHAHAHAHAYVWKLRRRTSLNQTGAGSEKIWNSDSTWEIVSPLKSSHVIHAPPITEPTPSEWKPLNIDRHWNAALLLIVRWQKYMLILASIKGIAISVRGRWIQ